MPGARTAGIAGLYAVTPDIADTGLLVRKVDAAIRGGATVVQYRYKRADAALRLAQASALARLPAMRDAWLIVNDDAAVAAAVGADGVHLGEGDAEIDAARAIVGRDRVIGISCYDDVTRACGAVAAGAVYVAFGSFFASTSIRAARRADRALLASARALGVPVVAIGGITAANARALFEAGADAVAVIADVFGHDSDEAIVRAAAAIVAENPAPALSTTPAKKRGTR
jgi:thiamine-phosphate pyrophosphorylase